MSYCRQYADALLSRSVPMFAVALALGFGVLGLGACSDDATGPQPDSSITDSSITDSSITDSAITDSSITDGVVVADQIVGPSTGPLTCEGYTTPSFSKACVKATDCVVVMHQIDCCGTQIAIGVAAGEQTRFVAEEKTCAATYPMCGCATQTTKTEDGSSLDMGGDPAAVDCVGGVCTTYVKGCGKPCDTGTTCHYCATGSSTQYFACSTTCKVKSDCKDTALPECVTGRYGGLFCAASDANCTTK